MAKFLRVEMEKPSEKDGRWNDVHSYYFDLPSKEEFKAVEKRHFFELPSAQVC